MSGDKGNYSEIVMQQQIIEPFVPYVAPEENERNFVTGLARGLDIIRAFRAHSSPMGNAEIAELVVLPKATVSRLTSTLCELGYLEQDKNRGKYQLSVAILTLAYPVLSQNRMRQLAHDRLSDLAKITGQTIALAAASTDNTSMVYLDVFSESNTNTLRMDIGARVDIAKAAMGRAFLAGLNDEARQNYIRHLEKANAGMWSELLPRIDLAIEQVNDRGFCLVDGEWMKGTRGVAVPLRLGDDVMAINCGAPDFAVSIERLENEFGPRLVHVARQLEMMVKN